jgi:hypothetical protein
MDHNQIQIWAMYSHEVSSYAISTLYTHPYKSWKAETKNFFKRDNSVKNNHTITKFRLDLCIPMTLMDAPRIASNQWTILWMTCTMIIKCLSDLDLYIMTLSELCLKSINLLNFQKWPWETLVHKPLSQGTFVINNINFW